MRKNASRRHIALTQERLKEVLAYDADNGTWTRRISHYQGKAGSNAASVGAYGYLYCSVDGNKYTAHRLAFLYMTGTFPAPGLEIDRININKADCRWENLRIATCSQNKMNLPIGKANTSGYKGVSWSARRRLWVAQIKLDRRLKWLGYFDDPFVAHLAYASAADRMFGQFARLS